MPYQVLESIVIRSEQQIGIILPDGKNKGE